jgi:hypothetical protein
VYRRPGVRGNGKERFVRTRLLALLFVPLAGFAATAAHADVCDAAFMHDGGFVRFTGHGNLELGAALSFSEVSKSNGGACRARVQGTATFAYAGLPPGKSKLDYLMTVNGGKANFASYETAGEKPAKREQFDLRILGLFAYEGRVSRGQHFPGGSFRINIGKDAPVGGAPSTTIRIGDKSVGESSRIQTALGPQSCSPIAYDRTIDPTMISFKGLMLPIPGMKSRVTDWYCPAVSLVMKQDIREEGALSTVEITEIR